ncbi:MAG: ATP-dependent zinc metalloprotease FtsH [Planctomycetota bacterium]|nr:ATP-dependent zinc metalloprotease FtsH [Planctomycetota bacterium]MDA1178150.1 ATP-dependent zinc metalloprotease FtsH [Planctomycetota bacterium]
MDQPETGHSRPNKPNSPPTLQRRPAWNAWLPLLLLLVVFALALAAQGVQRDAIPYPFFKEQLAKDQVLWVKFEGRKGYGKFRSPPPLAPPEPNTSEDLEFPRSTNRERKRVNERFQVTIPEWRSDGQDAELEQLLGTHTQWYYSDEDDNSLITSVVVGVLLPLGLVLLFMWIFFRRTRDQIMGGGFLSGFAKSPARRYEQAEDPITFSDVAGLEGVKSDLQEIVDFLKEPEKFQRLGGRVPKGILLNGSPGTGKTLLARAVAGEAGVPFFSVNGSEFIQMFVGVGASRVRDLFRQAKETSPAIIFVDEIDAVGRQRGAGLGGGHDEREQTLNQILSEMDGFTRNDAVIVIAATNRPDVLDPALLRPGRFDRHVTVDRPTLRGRKAILKVHVRNVPLASDVDLQRVAEATVGLTGADLRNLVNEAALWATRNNKNQVAMDDFEHARDKVLLGSKREELLSAKEKRKTAYHEAGHALMAWFAKGANRVHKVTVIPRGRALGVTHYLPEEDRVIIGENELRDQLACLMAGRAAERLVYDESNAGAESDLERATNLARCMVTRWGMSERIGPVTYKLSDSDPFLGREMHEQRKFSEHTLRMIDEEVASIIQDAAEQAMEMLMKHRSELDRLADSLCEREELDEREITELIGPSVHHQNSITEAEEIVP